LRHSTKDEERRNRDRRGVGPAVGLALLVQLSEQGSRVIAPLLLQPLRGLNPGTSPVDAFEKDFETTLDVADVNLFSSD
jgi:hypothetical protein